MAGVFQLGARRGSNCGHKAAPFCAAAFEFQERPADYCGAGLTFSIRKQRSCADRFKLKLSVVKREGSLFAELHYDANLFSTQDINRVNEQLQTLIESVVSNPAASICELEILNAAQRRQLLVDFNATRKVYPEDKPVHRLFEEQVERTPDNVAIAFERQQLTYTQLNARANQLARHLQLLGVGPDVPVAICVTRCPEMLVGVLGILKAGGAYVPLDPEYPKERLAFMLKDTGAPVLLTQARFAASIPMHRVRVLCLDSGWDAIGLESEENPIARITAKNLAYVVYTSGSSGKPKGVMVEHRSLVNYLCWVNEKLPTGALKHLPLTTKLTFDMCLKQLFPPLLRGDEVWMLPEEVTAEPAALLSALGERTGAGINCVPSLWKAMLHAIHRDDGISSRANVEYVLFGGDHVSQALLESSFAELPALRIWNIYGPTEATANASAIAIGPDDEVTIGRPIHNTQIYILDSRLQPVPIGVQGELHIGGAGVARGYLNQPGLTAEKFVAHPFTAEMGARLYKTGDLARYLPDGRIECLGRTDYQVKIRGYRMELGEIEAALNLHPEVREAVVVAQEDALEEKRLVAYLVTECERRPAANDLRVFLREKLPEYMIPAVFVPLDTLPLMPNGKIDRRALPEPSRTWPELERAYVAPRTSAEELLVGIWSHVLDVERIGIHDDFFQLGGHSLLATQVVSRIRDAFGVEIPLRALFEKPTVAGLAENIDVVRRAGPNLRPPPIVPVARGGDLPLSFAQRRLWFIDQLMPEDAAYNIPAAVRLKGPLNVVALERSLNEIVKRHEALRTTFAVVDGAPVQIIAPSLTVAPSLVDLGKLSENERELEVRRLAAEEAGRPFDLVRGPLLRLTLLRLGEEEHVGLLVMHHIVFDGWSTGILIREMAVLYEAFSSGRSSPLAPLPIQYADFAHWQRQWLQGEILETQLAYWRRQLAGASPLLELPTDHPRPPIQTFRGAHQSLVLSKGVSEGLKALSRQEGVTLFMTLLAAFEVLLHRHTGQDDVIVGTPVANRNWLEIEGLIGFFANTLVLRTDLSGNPEFRRLLRRTREVCLGAYAHQDLPFERLVEELHLHRDLSRNPLFQVMFALRNDSAQPVELPGMTLSPVEIDSGTAHFDLILHMTDTAPELTGTLVYNTDLFEAATISRMLAHLQLLLEAVVADPDQRLSKLRLLREVERHQLLVEWNKSKTPALPYETGALPFMCLQQLFEAQVAKTPDAIAVQCEDKELTYAELNRHANQLAHHLRTLGVGPEVSVGMHLEHSLETIVGLAGILKSGGVYVPLDPAYPKNRLAHMIVDSLMPVLLTQERLVPGLPEHVATIVCLDPGWQNNVKGDATNPTSVTTHENLAYVIYTSGSTGQPKGVGVSHGSIASHCRDIKRYYKLESSDRILQFASLSFDLSLEEILPALITGARLVLTGTDVWPPTELHKAISESGITVLNLPTAYWQELAREWADTPDRVSTCRPRLFVVGGDVMSPEALERWRKTPMREVRLINAYGPTETTITAAAFESSAQAAASGRFQRIPIGRPLANRETYILDKYCNPVPIGVAGELHIGGAGLARGYLNQPDLTAAKFIPHLYSSEPGARLYKTGDRACYRTDGNIDFLGRLDYQVKIRGFRVEPEEIERVLCQHPAVRKAVVLARKEALEEKRLIAAYVVVRQDFSPSGISLP